MFGSNKTQMPGAADALPGRDREMPLSNEHFVHGRPLRGEFPGNYLILSQCSSSFASSSA